MCERGYWGNGCILRFFFVNWISLLREWFGYKIKFFLLGLFYFNMLCLLVCFDVVGGFLVMFSSY